MLVQLHAVEEGKEFPPVNIGAHGWGIHPDQINQSLTDNPLLLQKVQNWLNDE